MVVVEAEVEPEVGAEAQESDGGPSLDEIIARAEARDAAQQEPSTPAILYDDLTELADVDDDVVHADTDTERRPGGADDEEEG